MLWTPTGAAPVLHEPGAVYILNIQTYYLFTYLFKRAVTYCYTIYYIMSRTVLYCIVLHSNALHLIPSHTISSPPFFRCRNPLSSTFLFHSGGQQPLLPSRITLSLESASQGTSPAYWTWKLISLIWSHTRQFVISFIITVIIHYSFSLPLQAQNSSFPQILSSTVLLLSHPPDWLHGLQLFIFDFLGHVGFNLGTVC